jgi:hypothetical protein
MLMLMRSQKKLLARTLLALLVPPSLWATTLVRLSLDQLAAGADGVARVRCLSAESRWENGSIWTVTTAEVVDTMKGKLPSVIAVRLPGGRAGHFTAAVDGTPKFHPGDEAILFLEESRAGGYTVAGWVEGTFRIARDVRSGSETVTQNSTAFAVFDPVARAFRREGIRGMAIAEFRAHVAAAIARAEMGPRGEEKTR